MKLSVLKITLAGVDHPFIEASVPGEQVVVRSEDGVATYADLAQGLVRSVQHLRVSPFSSRFWTLLQLVRFGRRIDLLVD